MKYNNKECETYFGLVCMTIEQCPQEVGGNDVFLLAKNNDCLK